MDKSIPAMLLSAALAGGTAWVMGDETNARWCKRTGKVCMPIWRAALTARSNPGICIRSTTS